MATGTISLQQVQEELHAEDTPLRGLRSTASVNDTKRSRQNGPGKSIKKSWKRTTLLPTETSTTRAAYKIWRDKHVSITNYQM